MTWGIALLVILGGYVGLVVAWCAADLRPSVLSLSAACGIGAGLLGCVAGLGALCFGSGGGLVASGLALVVLGLFVTRFRNRTPAGPAPSSPPPGWLSVPLALALAGIASGGLVEFFSFVHAHPLGEWDAWAIWNLHARFLLWAADPRVALFSPVVTNRDYPLLLPGLVAAGWKGSGTASPAVPIIAALGFTAATVGVVAGAVAWLRGRTLGLFAGIVLLSAPNFVAQGASQYADVPLSFFFVTTIALLAAAGAREREPGRPFMALAGIAAGLAAWTKNEGLLLICALSAAHLVSSLLVPRRAHRDWAAFTVTLGALLVPLFWFKIGLAPASELLTGRRGPSVLGQLAIWPRYAVIGAAFIRAAGAFPVVALAAIAAALRPSEGFRRRLSSMAPSWLTLAAMLGGYFVVYVLTPFDLAWHLRTALDRLFMQLWPTVVFLTFVTLAAPEELLRTADPAAVGGATLSPA